jgi:hypothetical protein
MSRTLVMATLAAAVTLGGCIHVTRTTEPSATPTTVVVAPPGTTAVVQPTVPWCGGATAASGGTNFGACGSTR